ncbi:MAG TPA: CHRD domain-containing protein, partial [Xanthomonadales bacterium]|nr:CHRD domain-containing protein [Xanthomonadales bacterium]
DVLLGGNGADVLLGGAGADQVDGNQGNDLAALGAGDDEFDWDPGDGSDTVEGGADLDRMTFRGSAAAENITLAPNGARFRLTRDIGNIVMDVDDVERADVLTGFGIDNVTVADIAATDVADVRIATGSDLDTVSTRLFTAIAQSLDGGAPTAFPGDTLTVAGFVGDPRSSPLPAPGFAPLSHTNFEFGPAGSGGRVSGVVFADVDFDGTRDPAELPIAGARVYDDVDGDQAFDAGEPSVLSAADGAWELVFDSDQTVDLRVVAPAGTVARIGSMLVTLAGGTTVSGIDFPLLQGTVFDAFLTGWQETPPNASPAVGTGIVLLSPAEDIVSVTFDFAGLGSANTASHIHAAAPRGMPAPVLFTLPASNAMDGNFDAGPFAVTPAQVQQLRAGLWYFNVHSTLFQGGEIRGQIDNALFLDGFE